MILFNESEMCKHIDQLLIDGKYEEAIPFIEEVWEKEAQAEKAMLGELSRKLNALEKAKK